MNARRRVKVNKHFAVRAGGNPGYLYNVPYSAFSGGNTVESSLDVWAEAGPWNTTLV